MKKAAVLTSVAAGSNGSTARRDLPPSAQLAQPVQHHVSPLRLRLTGQLTSVAASADMDWAVVAGREVLKIIAIYSDDVKEVLNLRAGAKMSTNFAIQDVKWGNSFAKSTVATAASNGAVVIWDLNRPNVHKLERILTEHTRAVNRISFHPTEPVLLLSASQDGSMRLWDLRAKSIARNAFEGRAESVRDVQFSPTNPYEFVAAFENGSIQKWDIRFPTQHERKWNAHNGLALTVDWHPDGRLAASGGRDRLIKVWDMKSESRLPLYTISTIAPVARVSWRPGSDTQLASCALATDYAIHLWDLARPYIANQSLEAHDGVTTGLLWRDPNIIWSCSKDRSFARHDIRAHAYRPLSCLNTSASAWNVDGELTFAIDERPILSSAITATTSTSLPGTAALANGPNTTGSDGRTGIADTDTFDVDAFIAFATDLQLDHTDIWTSCDINAQLALDLGLLRTAQTWKIIQLLYGGRNPGAPEPSNLSALFRGAPDKHPNHHPSNSSLSDKGSHASKHTTNTIGRSFPRNRRRSQFSASTLPTNNNSSDNINHASVPPRDVVLAPWNHEPVVRDALSYYAEQGNVQMCVSIILVLGDLIRVDEKMEELWFWSYIDLLHRFKLWSPATAVIRAARIPSVRARNQESTTIHTICNHCSKPMLTSTPGAPNWACEHCGRLVNPCSLCHKTTKGLYVWCQGCTHGGHLACLTDWFSNDLECCTGCGHQCLSRQFSMGVDVVG
ncbi:WD40-repeat-containing domain protein [Powellomyces hirtus]|nr:WD40-repeat-containing domain protein [Powellomyces hirtus]